MNRVPEFLRIGHGRLARVLTTAVALAALDISMATAQSLPGLRGNVDDGQAPVSLLKEEPLTARSTALTKKKKPAAEANGQIAPKPYIPEDDPEAGLDPADRTVVIGLDPQAPRLPMGVRARTQDDPAATGSEPVSAAKKRKNSATADANDPQDLLTGTIRTRSMTEDDEERNTRVLPENVRTPTVDLIDAASEQDPYAPLGLRIGTFTVTPTLETGLTATDNALSSTNKQSGIFSDTTLRLKAVSDWSVHQAEINAFAAWRQAVSGPGESEPNLGIDGKLRYDLGRDHAINAAAGYELRREAAESPVAIPAGATRPLLNRFDASLGLERTAGQLRYAITGEISRDAYGDASLAGGGTLSQTDRNFTLADARLRVGYAVSPALTPFVEVEYGRRVYDNRIDASGYARSADRYALRGGVALDLGEKLNGDLAVGYVRESLDDARLADIGGLSLLANLNWSPQRGTKVSLTAGTTVEGTTTAGESGSLLQSATLGFERQIRANFTANAELSASLRDYSGTGDRDMTLAGQLGFTWWLNRNVGLSARVRHERLTSNLPGRDYTTNSAFLGLKLQR